VVTDTRYYWTISENIFRYTHHNLGKVDNALAGGVHTVNERACLIYPVSVHCVLVSDVVAVVVCIGMEMDAFLETIRFYVTLILNLDENRDI